MALSSQKLAFDNRLLAVEELLRQRKYTVAQQELVLLKDTDFAGSEHEIGLLLALRAEAALIAGEYRKAIEQGLQAVRIFADLPLHRRYGRVLITLSRAYISMGDLRNAEIRARDALASFRRAGDSLGQVDAINWVAQIAFIRADLETAASLLDEALTLVSDNPRKSAQLTGNLARTRILLGQWVPAEQGLQAALQGNLEQHEEQSEALNRLSLGFLHVRRREFGPAQRELDKALALVQKLDLKREKVIQLEYAGELAFEKGDTFRAKSILAEAYHQGRLLAPESALVSQSARRLAEVEFALDNHDEAMKYGQKGLELARQLGERSEIGMSQRIIARVFASRGQIEDALEHIRQAVEVLRTVGDPYDLGRALLVMAEIEMLAGAEYRDRVRACFDESLRIFKKLHLDYWVAETDFQAGIFACQNGDLALGFRRLSRAEKLYTTLDEKSRVRAVNQFLHTLSDQAVALSISEENEFKLFGNLITPAEIKDLKTGHVEEILRVLLKKVSASRALIYAPDFESEPVTASFAVSPMQSKRFADNFQMMLGQEISRTKPTLLLDCRRDPYINGLLPDVPEPVASVIVVPFQTGDGTSEYLYIDRLSNDNLLNPFGQADLNFAVGFSTVLSFKAAEIQKLRLLEDNRRLKAQLLEQSTFPNIITCNRQMLAMLAQVRQIVDSPISVSIEGETGSGKDLLARAIHYNSNRRDRRFISVNCAALPETLLESELFGYKRGAFTGADRDKVGLFEEANGGTFFLDEVGDMPLSIQAKVLRLLEDKELVRLGETVSHKVDVRIVSATNHDLKKLMAAGKFRQDLYYRLSALTFRICPLRDRRDDIPLLVDHFLAESGKNMSPEAMKYLVGYDWPGNIRELENEVKKLMLLAGDSKTIGPDILSSKLTTSHISESDSPVAVAIPANGNGNGSNGDPSFGVTYSLYDYLAYWEKKFIMKALKEQRGVKKHAAAALNIPESTLRLKIKQYDIDLERLDTVA